MGTQLFCTQLASSSGQPEKATLSLQRAGRDGQGLHWPREDAFPRHLRILRVPPPQDTPGTSTMLRETWYREGAGGGVPRALRWAVSAFGDDVSL